MARTLKDILDEIGDMDFSQPHAWELAATRLKDAEAVINFVNKAWADKAHKKRMDVIDQSIFKLDQMGRIIQ